jgi:hippurate hydrolase
MQPKYLIYRTRRTSMPRTLEMNEITSGRSAAVADVDTRIGAPPLTNSARETKLAVRTARASVGKERVVTEGKPVAASEDFAFLLEKIPGAFIFLGSGVSEDGSFHNFHTPSFDFNDAMLPFGIQYWINLVHEELSIR